MLLILLLGVIGFSVASYLRGRDYDARVNYGREIADHFDLKDIFENAYLGGFEFDEEPPHEELRRDVEAEHDRGVESRLAFHFAKALPKWVLQACAKDIKAKQFNYNGTYSKYIDIELDKFTAIRNAELAELLHERATPSPSSESDRRRRRRR